MIRRSFLLAALAALLPRWNRSAPMTELQEDIEQALGDRLGREEGALFRFQRGPDGKLTWQRSYL